MVDNGFMFLAIIDSDKPDAKEIHEVVKSLQNGAVIIYPTDTGYAMGCALSSQTATQRVASIQKRDPRKPFTLVCSNVEMAKQFAKIDEFAEIYFRQLLPGPYTFILKATKNVEKIQGLERSKVGVRIPRLAVTSTLIKQLGVPLISSTVRVEGKKTIDPLVIARQHYKQIDGIVDGGTIMPEETSVVDLSEGTAQIIREGVGPVSFFRTN